MESEGPISVEQWKQVSTETCSRALQVSARHRFQLVLVVFLLPVAIVRRPMRSIIRVHDLPDLYYFFDPDVRG